jgi:predicted RNase H-like nuclease
MASYVGLDWASNGWVVARLDDAGNLSVGFAPTVWNWWHERDRDPEQVLVDIPVGLAADRRRACDREAQARLGGRAGSVFLTPIRQAVYENGIEAAKARHDERDAGYSISNQAWAIVPRIREVDTFLRRTDEVRALVRESHPELCFRKLNRGDEPVGAKADADGIERRKRLVCEAVGVEREQLDATVETLTEPRYAPRAGTDDVLDAAVLAATAERVADGDYVTLPEDPPEDAAGLPMEIVAPEPP